MKNQYLQVDKNMGMGIVGDIIVCNIDVLAEKFGDDVYAKLTMLKDKLFSKAFGKQIFIDFKYDWRLDPNLPRHFLTMEGFVILALFLHNKEAVKQAYIRRFIELKAVLAEEKNLLWSVAFDNM
jgi:hypothetical protein